MTVAVVLAAGRGTRLGSLTAHYPKALIEVGRTPVLERVLRGWQSAGVREAIVVIGHYGSLIRAAVGDGGDLGLRVRYREQADIDGTASALRLARDSVGQDPFAFSWGDVLVPDATYARVLSAAGPGIDAVLAVNEVEDPAAGAAVYLDDDRTVTRIVEKPAPGTSTTRWNNAGIGVLGTAIWDHIDALRRSERGEFELPGAIAALVAAGGVVRGVPVEGPWFDVGTPDVLRRANAVYGRTPS